MHSPLCMQRAGLNWPCKMIIDSPWKTLVIPGLTRTPITTCLPHELRKLNITYLCLLQKGTSKPPVYTHLCGVMHIHIPFYMYLFVVGLWMYTLKAEYLSGIDLDGLVVYATVKSHSWDVQHIVKIRKKEQKTLQLAVKCVVRRKNGRICPTRCTVAGNNGQHGGN